MPPSLFPQDSALLSLVVLPILIFLARICDVSIGTLRIIFVSRGHTRIAPVLGFFEVTIWLLAISQVMSNLTSPIHILAYGTGFATGTYVGMLIERRIALGNQVVRIITRHDATALVGHLRGAGHFVTAIDGEGEEGPVKLLFLTIPRRELPEILGQVKRFNPNAIYTVEDVRYVSQGAVYAPRQPNRYLALLRKGK